MLKTTNAPMVEAFAQVLETMAFISLSPIAAPHEGPPDTLLTAIDFTGPFSGAVELVASEEFAVTLAANVLGSSRADPNAADRARDAVKELVNVTCGALLSKLGHTCRKPFEVGIPRIAAFDPSQWQAFLASPDSAAFDADGHTVALRVRGLS